MTIRGMSIQAGWAAEPIQRAQRNFDGLWRWLERNGWADWHRVHAIATSFHPDYAMDQTTRRLKPDASSAGRVFLQMERGRYKREWVAVCLPVLALAIPKSRRGTGLPDAFIKATLHVSACLAAHEFERLLSATEAQPHDPATIARHLYWFERFHAVWQRVAINKPPAFGNNEAKGTAARERTAKLMALHGKRQRSISGGKASARQTAVEFAGSESAPEFWQDYRALLAALKGEGLRAKRKPAR